ncbi:MAG: hypothetical protein KJ646_01965 [Nanoarchaeota archaeon]|nr:hypothetical protein [Nanoarchaeota archaeon]MBU4116850.1 hypothetical protein [Nanoarchaeota archaeon]
MNKQGFLLAEETLKIIIAVICIIFLIYFLTALYFAKVGEEKLKYATATLKNSTGSLETAIEEVRSAKKQEVLFALQNPLGWNLISFIDEKPNSCAGKNCLCICDDVWDIGEFLNRQLKECSVNGVCLIVPDLKEEKLEIEINKQFLLINKLNNEIIIKEK